MRVWLSDPIGQVLAFLLHPIIHVSVAHLLGNTIFGLIIIGVLVESWMRLLKRRARYTIFLICYLVSLGVGCMSWISPLGGHPPLGSSGLIFAMLPFTVFYYLAYCGRIRFDGLNRFAPIGIGFVAAFLVLPFVIGFTETGNLMVSHSAELHLFAAVFSSVAATLFYGLWENKEA